MPSLASLKGVEVPLSNYSLDKFVAPKMSEFTSANVPDMSEHDGQQHFWTLNFVLNTMLRVDVAQPYRAWIYAFLRYTQAAFDEYELARQAAIEYLSGNRHQHISPYLRALYHYEAFLAQADQARTVLSRMDDKAKFFEKGDGSVLQRLNLLHNKSKHADIAIQSGETPGDTTMALWLSNEGICHNEAVLKYEEMATLLTDLADKATRLSNPPVLEGNEPKTG